MAEKFYTVKEVAESLGVCTRTILRKIASGDLKRTAISKRDYRIAESDLQQFIKSCKSN